MYHDYEAQEFEQRVSNALQNVKGVLDTTRNPQLPKDVSHAYDNKFTLAELAVKSGMASMLNVLELVAGLDDEKLSTLKQWSQKQTVTLAYSATESCKFLRTTTRNEESDTSYVTERTGFLAGTSTSKTVTKITEHFWKFGVSWKLTAYPGTGAETSLTLLSRAGSCELKTVGKEKHAPAPETRIANTCTLDVSWLLANLTEDGKADFAIDRSHSGCHTPRRNKDVDDAMRFLLEVLRWSTEVQAYVNSHTGREKDLNPRPKAGDLLSPIQAMFTFESDGETPHMSGLDFDKFLQEHARQLRVHQDAISTVVPAAESAERLNTSAEMGLVFGLGHCISLSRDVSGALATVEAMLRQQVVAAIGKEVSATDLTQYMEYHCRQLLREEYQPKGFCYAVRRPDHYPEGTLSIEYGQETAADKDGQSLVRTVVHSSGETEPGLVAAAGGTPLPATQPMKFALDAATTVTFGGERHLHACVLHQFSGRDGGSTVPLRLLARARQFSSFVLLVGKIASADLFEPTAALIIRDKDDLEIPLILETMPTPKEFKDAIESLSPEQQRFCKAFRSMQLASTLFGVCVIQIKPQMERLLNIPPDSLTKEIQLTNDLMDLFIKYQIPSDLISYAGDPDASTHAKIVVVKEHVAALMSTIAKAKETELADEKQEAAKALAYAAPSGTARLRAELELSLASSDSFGGGGSRGKMKKYKKKMSNAPPPPPQPACAAPPPLLACAAPPPLLACAAPPPPDTLAEAPTSGPSERTQQLARQQSDITGGAGGGGGVGVGANAVDYTQIPSQLDRQCEVLDKDNALRPTTIKTGERWQLKYQKGLLSKPESRSLGSDQQAEEKAKAFDLLDALSRSGVLSIEAASLHIMLAATHCFDKTMMDTIVQDNVNPIEPVERSLLIVAGVVHGRDTREMLQGTQVDRIAQFSPQLLRDGEDGTPVLENQSSE